MPCVILTKVSDHEADRGLEAGEGDGDGKNDLADAAEVMARDLRQGDAAVVGDLKQPARLRAHEDGHDVDDGHQDARQRAGAQHVDGDSVVIVHAHAADDVDDHDAEGQTGDGVHGAVALNKGGKEGTGPGRVSLHGLDRGDRGAGIGERGDHEHGEEEKEDGVDDLADPDRDLAGAEREEQDEREENGRENEQRKPLFGRVEQHGRHAGRERDGRASGDGEQRADGQIQKTGEENAVALADLA